MRSKLAPGVARRGRTRHVRRGLWRQRRQAVGLDAERPARRPAEGRDHPPVGHEQRPAAGAGHPADRPADSSAKTGVNVKVELVGWDVQFDRIRNAAVSGGGPGRDPGRHHAGAVLRRARRLLGRHAAHQGHRRQGRVRAGHLADDAARRPGRDLRDPVVHRGARDLLPQGRPREGGRRPGHGVQGLGRASARRSRRSRTRSRRSTASRSRRSARPARRRSTSSTT